MHPCELAGVVGPVGSRWQPSVDEADPGVVEVDAMARLDEVALDEVADLVDGGADG